METLALLFKCVFCPICCRGNTELKQKTSILTAGDEMDLAGGATHCGLLGDLKILLSWVTAHAKNVVLEKTVGLDADPTS